MKIKLKTGDMVRVMAGKDKDKEGKITAIDHKNGRVKVEGANMVTKHSKPSQSNSEGGISTQEAFLDVSNVMYLHKGEPTRIGYKLDGDKKVRIAKKTGDVID